MSDTIRVGVNGAGGRMGRAVCGAVHAAEGLSLVAAVDVAKAGETVHGVDIARELRSFADSGCDVVVDFTVADAARVTLPWLAMHDIHAVVGTTGLADADLDTVRSAFGNGPAHCLLAPNFAISAVLMMRFAAIAAPYFDTAEIIEYHHDEKVDAPSGTALTTAELMASSRGDRSWHPDPTDREVPEGARGGTGPGAIHIHSVRMHGMIAHQDVILGAAGQTLTIRQDSYDRASFLPGVVLACRRIADHPGVVIGLEHYLEL